MATAFNWWFAQLLCHRCELKAPGSGYANEGGSYALSHTHTTQENLYLAANLNYQINKDWEVHGFLREEYFNQYAQYNSESTNGGLIVPNQFFIKNSKQQASFNAYKIQHQAYRLYHLYDWNKLEESTILGHNGT